MNACSWSAWLAVALATAGCSGGTVPSDTGTGGDAGTDAAMSGDVPSADVAPVMFAPSNFTLSQTQSTGAPAVITGAAQGDCSANTANGTWNCTGSSPTPTPPFSSITLSDGTMATLWTLHALTVNAGSTFSLNGPLPAIIYVETSVSIAGAMIVTAGALSAGSGAGNHAPRGTGGAGGGSYCGIGGHGSLGDGTDSAGTAYGSPTLVPLAAGSGGGTFAELSNGGGALQISAYASITVSGSINAGGRAGVSDNDGAANFGDGGGSGGAILLESSNVTIAGTLAANGGGGGSSIGAGLAGAASSTPAQGGGMGGGTGSGGANTSGAAGTSNATGVNPSNGGGGGGAGRIRINSVTGAVIRSGAVISPAASTTCLSQGTVH